MAASTTTTVLDGGATATVYGYAISAIASGKVSAGRLDRDVRASASIGSALMFVSTRGDLCSVAFSRVLTVAEVTTLDGLVSAHPGVDTAVMFRANSKMVNGSVSIVSVATWQVLGGVLANLSFFLPDLTRALSRVVGGYRTTGIGAELRVVEESPVDNTEVVLLNATPLPDSAGAWRSFEYSATAAVPRTGPNFYRLEGRLNGAVLAEVRYASGALIELVTL